MLVKKDYKDKTKSIYKCDMCNKEITEVITLFELINKKKHKKIYDLCDKCYRTLNASLIRYRKKHEEANK